MLIYSNSWSLQYIEPPLSYYHTYTHTQIHSVPPNLPVEHMKESSQDHWYNQFEFIEFNMGNIRNR